MSLLPQLCNFLKTIETLTNTNDFSSKYGAHTRGVLGGKVIEVLADTPVGKAVKILSETDILATPVKDPDVGIGSDRRDRYLGIIGYSAIILCVMESVELAAVALSA
ncbi:hypothetical protein RYX36_006734, partial [Vicia faba]